MISLITHLYAKTNSRPSLHHCPSLPRSVSRHHREQCRLLHPLRPLLILPQLWLWLMLQTRQRKITTRPRRKKRMILCWCPARVSCDPALIAAVPLPTTTRVMSPPSQYPSLPNGELFSRSAFSTNLTLPLKCSHKQSYCHAALLLLSFVHVLVRFCYLIFLLFNSCKPLRGTAMHHPPAAHRRPA